MLLARGIEALVLVIFILATPADVDINLDIVLHSVQIVHACPDRNQRTRLLLLVIFEASIARLLYRSAAAFNYRALVGLAECGAAIPPR